MFHYEWDPQKAEKNFRKHGISFADTVSVFEDDYAIKIPDEEHTEEDRFITLGEDARGRLLVVVFTFRGDKIRIISARKANGSEIDAYQRD